ncbi:hypothetical protein PM082_001777 [Marasmius tenuissimus]|nr:hypothetical protein PM082_001777 [Marasmius tenuissimus]
MPIPRSAHRARVHCPYVGCIRTFTTQGYLSQHLGTGIHSGGSLRSARLRNSASPACSTGPDPSPNGDPPPDEDDAPHIDSPPLPLPLLSPGQNYMEKSPTPEPTPPEDIITPTGKTYRFHPILRDDVNELLDIWRLDCRTRFGVDAAPLESHRELLSMIDSIKAGDAPWICYETSTENIENDAPEYKRTKYQVWYRNPDTIISNILSNPDFANEFDAAPYVHLNSEGKRRVSDFMSGNFAFRHSTIIHEDVGDTVDGAMYCPIIIGADKTTVSVATGHVEYHPIYISIGNLRNCARRGHRNGVIPVGFLAIPKADRKYDNDPEYRVYKKQLYHASIAAIFAPIKSAMLQPVVRLCPDGHYRRVIYDLAAFIADYPEQVYLAGIVSGWCCKCTARNNDLDGNNAEMRTREWFEEVMQGFGDDDNILWDNFGIDNDIVPFTHYFPRADIHEMLTADLLHQVIKGCFKDMLVEWVWDYIKQEYGDEAEAIMDDIDKRISIVPEFPGLRRFPQGRRFKQWTGDDSKALMKVFLPAVEPFIPPQMTKCLAAFLDFCYLVRRNDFDEDTISEIQRTVERFHSHRQIFVEQGIRDDFSVPRMHSMVHYPYLILNFGAPNGVCSSITESRHITAVKKPWRRSNQHNALSQILLTNQRLDKLAAKRVELVERGLLPRLHNPPPDPFEVGAQDTAPIDKDGIEGEVALAKRRAQGYSGDLNAIANALDMPTLPWLTQRFLYEQTTQCSSDDIPIESLPEILSKVNIYHSAVATFRSPSDESGLRGMRKERIRASPSYRGHPRHDTVAVVTDQSKSGFRGMSAARVLLLFSFKEQSKTYQCALVHWFNRVGQVPSALTGMWAVRPAYLDARKRRPHLAVIHIDTILRGIHLVPIYGNGRVPRSLKFYQSLDAYNAYYVNNTKA